MYPSNKIAKLRGCISLVHFAKRQNLKAVGHSFQKIYDVPWYSNVRDRVEI